MSRVACTGVWAVRVESEKTWDCRLEASRDPMVPAVKSMRTHQHSYR